MKLFLILAVLLLAGCNYSTQGEITNIEQSCRHIQGVVVTKHAWIGENQHKFEIVCTNITQAQPPQ
jgi:outer membrane lipopolysaccharide assembly protein LptE/RlpB